MLSRLLAGLLLIVLPVAANAAPPMLIATSSHFTIYAAEKEADLRAFAEGLESYDAVLRRLTGVHAGSAEIVPLTIYVKPDQESLGAGWGVIGYYSPVAAGAFAVVPQKTWGLPVASIPRIVLFHEYAHHFVLQNFPTLYSPWFVEGSAEFYSTIETGGGKAIIGKPEPLRIGSLMGNWRTTLPHLLAPGDKDLTSDQTEELYARSWLLVHYLTLSTQRGGQIDAYLRARSAGATEEQAFQSALHSSIAAMDRELKSYFAPHALAYATMDLPAGGTVAIRPASPDEAAVAKLIPRLRGLQAAEDGLTAEKSGTADRIAVSRFAGNLAVEARAAARKFPDSAAMQEMVAESDLLAGQLDQARVSAGEAVRLQPANARAHLVLAAVALAGLAPGDNAGLAALRKEIVTANRAAPDDPLPLIAYYKSFSEHGAEPPPIAVQGLERAYQLAPQDDGVRVLLATKEIDLKHYAMAAGLLRPVAFSPHPGPRRDSAQKLLNALPGAHEQAPPVVEGGVKAAAGGQ